MIRPALLLALLAAAAPASADVVTIPFAGATMTDEDSSPASSVRLPEAPASVAPTPPQAEGAITRRAWRVPGGSWTTLQLLDPLRDQLQAEGYAQVFTCADAACGGFDFRFELDILGEPGMHVDLGDFRYLLMRRDGAGPTPEGPSEVSIVTSRSAQAGYIHVTEVAPAQEPGEAAPPSDSSENSLPAPPPQTPAATAPAGDILIAALETRGHVVLEDLDFGSGSADLGPGPFPSLDTLGAWLAQHPSARIALVGHTDAVGSLDANVALSTKRAQAAAARLTAMPGVAAVQVQALGAGWLAPRASNLTEAGRALNRRVEAVLLAE